VFEKTNLSEILAPGRNLSTLYMYACIFIHIYILFWGGYANDAICLPTVGCVELRGQAQSNGPKTTRKSQSTLTINPGISWSYNHLCLDLRARRGYDTQATNTSIYIYIYICISNELSGEHSKALSMTCQSFPIMHEC